MLTTTFLNQRSLKWLVRSDIEDNGMEMNVLLYASRLTNDSDELAKSLDSTKAEQYLNTAIGL